MDPSIKVYLIRPDTKRIEHIRFDSKMALLLSGSAIVYDRSDDTFKMIAHPTEANLSEARDELLAERDKRRKWRETKINRSLRG